MFMHMFGGKNGLAHLNDVSPSYEEEINKQTFHIVMHDAASLLHISATYLICRSSKQCYRYKLSAVQFICEQNFSV